MSITAKLLSVSTLATATVLLALSCQGPASNPASPESPPIGFEPRGPVSLAADNCLRDETGFTQPNICTAQDTGIAEINVTGGPIECDEGDPIAIPQLDTEIVSTAAERNDISIYLALDGGDAKTGECFKTFLAPPLSPDPSDCTIDNHDPDGGPWFNAECDEDPADTCGDLVQNETNILEITNQVFTCADDDSDGFLDVGFCVGWDNTKTATCEGVEDALPNTTAKCNCGRLNVPITVNKTAKIEVVKACDPTEDDGLFDLQIDGTTEADEAECGDSTGEVTVSAGTQVDPGDDHTVGEVADTETTLDDYVSDISCVDDGETTFDGGDPLTQSDAGPLTVPVDPEDDIVCTITNVRKGTIIIEKETDPAGGTGFGFTDDIESPNSFSLDDTDTKTFDDVIPDATYEVIEDDPTPGYDLESIVCDDDASDTPSVGDVDTRTATIELDPGETVTCTFTNRERGTIKITKETDPAGGTGFGFTDDIESPNMFSLDDTQTETFDDVVSDATYEVIEDDPNPGYDLTDVDCDDDASDTPSVGDVDTRTATIELDPGETVECTFTNTQRAMVTANKTQSGSAAAGFDFEIRQGADGSDSGDLIAEGTSDGSGVVDFACAAGVDPDICQDDSNGDAKIVPGDYQFCEVHMMPGWMNNITGFTPDGETAEGGDNSTECIDITLAAGQTGVPSEIPDPINNEPPPGGDARTIGFWKNWSSCDDHGNQDPILDQWLASAGGFLLGDLDVDTCEEAILVLDKRDLNGKNKKRANDACYALASQMLAALLNVEAGANSCQDLTDALDDAQDLLDDNNYDGTGNCLPPNSNGDRSEALDLASEFDAYNNNEPGSLCN